MPDRLTAAEYLKLFNDAIALTQQFRTLAPDPASRMTLLSLASTMVIADSGITETALPEAVEILTRHITSRFSFICEQFKETLQ